MIRIKPCEFMWGIQDNPPIVHGFDVIETRDGWTLAAQGDKYFILEKQRRGHRLHPWIRHAGGTMRAHTDRAIFIPSEP